MEIVTSWELEGRRKAAEQIARNLLREGLAVELVVRATGLTEEQVRELQNQVWQ